MKKTAVIFLSIAILAVGCFTPACVEMPTEEHMRSEQEMLLEEPQSKITLSFDSYEALAAAILDCGSSAYNELRTDPDNIEDRSTTGEIYNSFIDKLESGELSFPMPKFGGKTAKLVELDASIAVFSSEKFNLPCIWYYVDCDGVMVTVEVFPLSVVDEIKLTGSETYSDISKKLAPLYPTEDMPKEKYDGKYNNVTAREIELAGGRRVWATVIEGIHPTVWKRTAYRFIYDGYIVSVWNMLDEDVDRLTDDFFKAFSLGGDLTSLYKQA